MKYYNSRYNFCLPAEDGVVLYNAARGSTSFIKGKDSTELGELLCNEKLIFEESFFDELTLQAFLANGFLIEEYRCELSE